MHSRATGLPSPAVLRLSVFLLSLLAAAAAFAQKAESPVELRGEPIGESRSLEVVPDLTTAVRDASGDQVWTYSLKIDGAAFLRPRFANFNLVAGDRLIVRSASGRVVEELTRTGPKARRSFWGLSAFGEELHLELRFSDAYRRAPFLITDVIVGDPKMLESVTDQVPAPPQESICTPSDFEDVVCYDDDGAKWANVLASAGVATANTGAGALWCSGSNISPLNYVLTNHHCIADQSECDNAEFIFKYYRTGCNDGSAPTVDWVSYRCDEVVAFSPQGSCDAPVDQLDFSLHSVVGDPASLFGYVTPDPTPLADGEAIYIVQHPSGRPHEIAHGSGANVDVDDGGDGSLSVLRYYDTLDTEGGSSGSPVFRESDDLLVGLHHCGGCSDAGVGNRGMLMSDIYPLISEFVCQDALSLLGGAASDVTEVAGNGDASLDPGETWQFVPSVRNGSCDLAASGVTASFAAGAGSVGLTLIDATSSFGSIPAGDSAAGTPVRFTIDAEIACAGEVVIDMTDVSATGGGPFGGSGSYVQAEIGLVPTTTALFEDFAAGMPGTWSVVDGGTGSGAASTWTDADPDGRGLLDPPFMIADSDALGTDQTMDEELISPLVDTSTFDSVTLQFSHNYNFYEQGGDEKAEVDVRSSATSGAWVNVHSFAQADTAGVVSFDLTPYSAADLQVRFHYYDASFDWWWAVDDVYVLEVGDRQCEAFGDIFSDDFESGDATAWSAGQL